MDITRRSALSLAATFGISQFAIGSSKANTSSGSSGTAWSTNRYNSQNTGAAVGLSLPNTPVETWSKHVDDPTPPLPDRELSTPVMAENKLFYTTDRAIVARSAANGSLVWSVEDSNRSNVDTSPVVSDGKVITAGTNITAWSTDTGDRIWDTTIGGSSDAALNMDGDSVYITISGRNGMIKSFDIDSGEEQWSTRTRNIISTSVAIDDGVVYAVDRRGFVYCIEDGEQVWRSEVEGVVWAPPTVTDDYVIIGGIDVTFTLLNKFSGEVEATYNEPTRADNPPVWYNEYCILSNTNGDIIAVDLSTSEVDWSRHITEELNTAPIVVDDALVVGTPNGTIRKLDIKTGETKWRISLFDSSVIGLIGGNDAVYAVGDDGIIAGTHIEGTLTPRIKIQQLSQKIRDAETFGVPTGQAESQLSTAISSIQSRNYDSAQNEAEAGISEFDQLLQEVQAAREKMDTVRNDATEFENDTPANTSTVTETLDRGIAEIERGNPNEAIELSQEAEQSLEDLKTNYEGAKLVIEELESNIEVADSMETPVYDAPDSLREAETEFQNGNFVEAEKIAAQENDELEKRIETVRTVRDRFGELEELMEQAENENIDVSEGESLFSDSASYYSDEEYTQALDTANHAIRTTEETLDTAKEASDLISQAESFSAIQPFVETLAEDFGSEEHLSKAKSEYESTNYHNALTEAQNARRAQQQARVLVDGGSVAALAGGYVFWKKDGVRKIADIIKSKDDE